MDKSDKKLTPVPPAVLVGGERGQFDPLLLVEELEVGQSELQQAVSMTLSYSVPDPRLGKDLCFVASCGRETCPRSPGGC